MIELREYLYAANHSPFARWFDELDAQAAIRVGIALGRMEMGKPFERQILG